MQMFTNQLPEDLPEGGLMIEIQDKASLCLFSARMLNVAANQFGEGDCDDGQYWVNCAVEALEKGLQHFSEEVDPD